MATIIDNTYFNGHLTVGQKADNLADLNSSIEEHEPVVMKNLLGYALYKDFLATPAAARHTDLLNGKEYTNRKGELDKWLGLKFVSGATKKSLIANYVYFRYINNNVTQSTGSGEKTLKGENSVNDNPRYKLAKAWNEMVGWNLQLREFLLANAGTYPEYVDPLTMRSGIDDRQDLLELVNPYV